MEITCSDSPRTQRLKVWHRTRTWRPLSPLGRPRHNEFSETIEPPATIIPGPAMKHPEQTAGKSRADGPVMFHHHTTTVLHTRGQHSTVRTTLQHNWSPGRDGTTAPDLNWGSLCGEIGEQMSGIQDTLKVVRERCSSALQQQLASEQYDDAGTTFRSRQELAGCLTRQVDFFTGCAAAYSHYNSDRYCSKCTAQQLA